MKSKKFVLAGLALLAITGLLALAGCKNDSVPETPAAKLVSISVTPPERTVYSVEQEFDSTGMKVTATYDDKSQREVTGWTTDFGTVAGKKGLNKPVTVSYTEGDTSKSDTFTVTVFPKEVKVLTGYTSPNNTDSKWTYVEFGEWPQTEAVGFKPTTTPQSHRIFVDNYYVEGNDKYVEKDGQYYKVEPIVWRVLTTSYKAPEGGTVGEILLLAEKILTGGIPYYVDLNTRTITGAGTKEGEPDIVYPNNWQYSTIRAWLNGLDVVKSDAPLGNDKTYTNNGFLQTAFTADAQSLIAATSVDNSAASTIPSGITDEDLESYWNSGENPYASDTPTKDKIFLLSEQEATNSEYGFAAYDAYGKGSTRIRVTTDYATKATGAYQSSTPGYGGWWWLRSPLYSSEYNARVIHDYGIANRSGNVLDTNGGVVPALSISLGGN